MARHLLVTNDFPPKIGGIQSYLWELWQRLDPATFAVLTASSHPDAEAFDAAQRRRGLRIERVRARTLYLPTRSVRDRVRALAAETDASLVVLDPVLPLGLLGRSLGLPYAVVLHGAEVAVPAAPTGSRRALASVLRGASLVVSAGRYPAEEAARATGGPLPSVVQVPPGVDVGRFTPLDPGARQDARGRLGLPESGPLVVSVSRLVPRKGMDVLVDASALLAVRHPGLTVAIAGTGRDERRLATLVRRRRAPVRLLGRVSEDDKAALLGAADVFAMACRNRWAGLEQEGFGIVFLEAAAAGVPQVAGDSGGAAEAVADGETGFVVGRPGEPAAVAAAIARLLDDEELRHEMGRAARARAASAFDYSALATTLAGALAEVKG